MNPDLMKLCQEACHKSAIMFIDHYNDKLAVRVDQATEAIRCWETVSRELHAARLTGKIDLWAIGDKIQMYHVICHQISKEILSIMKADGGYVIDEFEKTVFLMCKIEEYLGRWPTTNPEREHRIMEEHIRGECTTFICIDDKEE